MNMDLYYIVRESRSADPDYIMVAGPFSTWDRALTEKQSLVQGAWWDSDLEIVKQQVTVK